jgi:hypothetical protein
MTCEECINRFASWGDNPRVKSGRYHLCGCDYCNKPDSERDLEQLKNDVELIKRTEIPNIPEVRQLKYQVEQAKTGYLHLQKKLNEHLTNKRKSLDVI